MKHKKYEKPMAQTVWLQQQTQLLAGSEVSATISDFQEEEWDPTPSSRGTDLTELLDDSSDSNLSH